MSELDYDEVCDLYGVMDFSATYNRGTLVKRGTLASCVRTVMEEWNSLQRATAMILTNGPSYDLEAIKALYDRADFPRG